MAEANLSQGAADEWAAGNPYDETPYPDLSYVSTHPDRLATMATVLGLQPPAVATARVLDIGCAAGGNLLPMAYALPQAEIIGVDYSSRQVQAGRQRIQKLGVKNVTLLCHDLVDLAGDLGDELGQFDFIVAHGVYSWVPEQARTSLLRSVKRLLRPNGVAYMSYNTYPGWHITGIVRDAMLFHSRKAESPTDKAKLAREMVNFMGKHAVEEMYRGLFYSYSNYVGDGIKASSDAFLLHDELEEHNYPVYFREFVEGAQSHGLQYLCEVELRQVLPHTLSEETQTALQEFADDTIALEQYMDFLRNRMFRQTLLVHAETPLERRMAPQALFGCWVRSQAQPAPDEGSASEQGDEIAPASSAASSNMAGAVQFRAPDGSTLTTDHPVTQFALAILAEIWPQALPFAELFERAKERASHPAGQETDAPPNALPDEVILAANLLRAYGSSPHFAPLHSFLPTFTARIAETPVASPVARFEAQTRSVVTNMWHDRVYVEPGEREVLARLDGQHTRSDLLDALRDTTPLMEDELEVMLQRFAQESLLVR